MSQRPSLPKPVRLFVSAVWALIGLVVILAIWYQYAHKSGGNGASAPAESNTVHAGPSNSPGK